jgi:hypothetical protein
VSGNLSGAGTSNCIHFARSTSWRPIFLYHRNLPDESIFSLAACSAQSRPARVRRTGRRRPA